MIGFIQSNQPIAPGIYNMAIKAPNIAKSVRAGQFIHIRCGSTNDPLLRRPISVCQTDVDNGLIYISYQVKGKGTQWLSTQRQNEQLDILGPLGNSFDSFVSAVGDGEIWLVGGGIGVFPLQLLTQQLKDRRWITAILGFKSNDFEPLWRPFELAVDAIRIVTEDGSYGRRGFVTDELLSMLNAHKPKLIIGCGPTSMLKALSSIAGQYKVPCAISLEERMGCGIGGCLVCNCKIRSGDTWHYRRVCADGPVFWSHEVVFDE